MLFAPYFKVKFWKQYFFMSFQNLKNQIMTTNMWVEQVMSAKPYIHTRVYKCYMYLPFHSGKLVIPNWISVQVIDSKADSIGARTISIKVIDPINKL